MEVSRSAVNRPGIYAALQVPEVWRYTAQGTLEYLALSSVGGYEASPQSPSLPWIPAADLLSLLELARSATKPDLLSRVQDWLRDHRT